MNTSRSASAALAAATLLVAVLAGCGGSSGQGPGNGAGLPTSTGPHSSAAAAVPTTTTGVPTPDAAETAALIAALGAVDPDLVVNQDEAVSNAVTLCASLQAGDPVDTAVPAAFPHVDLGTVQTQTVAAAVEASFCPSVGSTVGVPTTTVS